MIHKKQYGIGLLKILLVLSIFAFLFWRAIQNDAIEQLIQSPKNGSFLFGGVILNLLATVLTMIRWNWLVRIQKISLSYRSALRFGFIGYLFNLSPIGIVGGDVVKAYLLFRHENDRSKELSSPIKISPQNSVPVSGKISAIDDSSANNIPITDDSSTNNNDFVIEKPSTNGDSSSMSKAAYNEKDFLSRNIASVIIDRVIGLYIMFLLGFVTIFATGFISLEQKEAKIAAATVLLLFVSSTIGLFVLFLPDSKNHWRHKLIRRIPVIGSKLESFFSIVQIYRNHPFLLGISAAATLVVHLLFAASLFCIAKGLFQNVPSFYDHLVIYPVANIGSMIPLSAGPLEYFLDILYPLFSIENQEPFRIGSGMLVGVTFRFATLLVALIGGLFYFISRNEISHALNEMSHSSKDIPQKSKSKS